MLSQWFQFVWQNSEQPSEQWQVEDESWPQCESTRAAGLFALSPIPWHDVLPHPQPTDRP